ncbi:MAG: anaerobic ribonucleoside-triphosphate reductase activating protein [Sarcina sp.]
MGKKIRLSGIAYESLVNGIGMRRVFFAQGCKHNCEGCFNTDTHDFKGGELFEIDELVADMEGNFLLKGVTFSGGDPMEQPEEFAYMAEQIKKLGLNIWSYTGYVFEDILKDEKKKQLLEKIDVLVDGKFEINKKEEGLKFKGSSNQRIIDVKESLKTGEVVILKC